MQGLALVDLDASWDSPGLLDFGQYRVSRDPVSFHLILHRCIGAFVFEAAYRHRADEQVPSLQELCCLDSPSLPKLFALFLIDHPIRTQVLCSQIESHGWVRNGAFAMAHQVSLYRNRLWHEMGMELDFFLMQCGAQLLGDVFVALALQRFELTHFFALSTSEQATFDTSQLQVATDFVTLLVSLGRDRTRVGMGKRAALRRELVCWLGVSDLTYSQLLDKIHPRFAANTDLIDQVKEALPCSLAHRLAAFSQVECDGCRFACVRSCRRWLSSTSRRRMTTLGSIGYGRRRGARSTHCSHG